MAKCRCNICKFLREPRAVDVSTQRFHAEPRNYKVEGGGILPEGIRVVIGLLQDFEVGLSDVGPLDFDTLEYVTRNNSRWEEYIEDGTDLYLDEIFFDYLDSIPGFSRSGMRIQPDSSPPPGRDEAERIKNFRNLLKKWVRWYSDRTNRIVRPLGGWTNFVESLGTEWVTKEGKYTTRLSTALFKSGTKLSKGQLETIANTLNDHVLKSGEYSFTFDKGYLTGRAHEYCHKDSCWWGGYERARPTLAANDGYAIRMWDNGNPVARCWIAPASGGYILFNAYGKLDLGAFSQVLSASWGMKFRKCSMQYPSTLYVNNGAGYHLHEENPASHIELLWSKNVTKPYSPPANSCSVCGEESTEAVCSLCATADMSTVEVLAAAGVLNPARVSSGGLLYHPHFGEVFPSTPIPQSTSTMLLEGFTNDV